jgi:hypothetical protein
VCRRQERHEVRMEYKQVVGECTRVDVRNVQKKLRETNRSVVVRAAVRLERELIHSNWSFSMLYRRLKEFDSFISRSLWGYEHRRIG